MKNILSILICLLSIGTTFVSCSDDDNNNEPQFEKSAEQDFAEIVRYAGTLYRVENGKTDVSTADAEVSILATDSAYIADMIFHCFDSSFKIDSLKGPVNIARANGGYIFYNNLESNMFKNKFSGIISEQGEMTTKFVMKIRSGRNTKTYNFEFNGSIKQ